MTLRTISLGFTLLLGIACSADSTPRGRGGEGDAHDGDPATGTDGDDGAGDGSGGAFDECAAARVDAETGLRAGNIVWVIDTSGSMEEEAGQVQQNMNGFVSSITAAGLADYRVVVVSEPEYVSVPEPLGSDDAHFLYVEEEVSSHEPLEDLLGRFDDFGDFLLEGVVTHFVVVTDDESDIPAEEFLAQMGQRLGGEFRVHAIASPPGAPPANGGDDDDDDDDDEGCVGPGVEHYRAAQLSEGLTFSICTEDWSALFGALADAVSGAAALPCGLDLPDAPAGAALDPELVNVLHTTPDAGESAWPRAESAQRCGAAAAWYYDDARAPTRIELCPAACELAKQGGSLEVALGCQGVLL